jgi:hypothetical protein
LHTERLVLRQWKLEDFEDIAASPADPEAMRYLGMDDMAVDDKEGGSRDAVTFSPDSRDCDRTGPCQMTGSQAGRFSAYCSNQSARAS